METRSPLPATPSAPAGPSLFQGASPKLTFIFGIIAGIAVTAIVGLAVIIPRAYGSSKTAKTNTNTAAAATNTSTAPTFSDVKKVSTADYLRGDKSAKLTLIEYSDLECPYCKTFHATMKQVMTQYDGQVNWVFRNFPLSFHANAQKEAEAALCVGKLGGNDKYWSFIDKIYERTTSNGTGFALTALGPLAKEVGVNQTNFQKCLDNGDMTQAVKDEESDGTAGGASGTPTTFIVDKNGKTLTAIPGAYPITDTSGGTSVKTILDTALAQS